MLSSTNYLHVCCSHISIQTDLMWLNYWKALFNSAHDPVAVAKLACSTTTVNNVIGYIVILTYFGHAVLITFSYIHLIKNCRKSKESTYKFMQTCVPHLVALLNITIALLFDVFYSRYGSNSLPQSLRNFMALDVLFIPPILNPLIYGLKLTKIRKQVMRLFLRDSCLKWK